MNKNNVLVALLLAALGCGSESSELATGPAVGKADSPDRADASCQVVLRDARRRQGNGPSIVRQDCSTGRCWWVFTGTVDVAASALAAGSTPAILYHGADDGPVSGGDWHEQAELTEVAGAPDGFQRFEFELNEHTVSFSGSSSSGLGSVAVHVIPFLNDATGRLFDHNRLPGVFSTYELRASNSWAELDDATACYDDPEITGTIQFKAGDREVLVGDVVGGAKLAVSVDPIRVPFCRDTHNGDPAWSLEVSAYFGGDSHLTESVIRFDQAFGMDENLRLAVFDVPSDASEVQLWLRNASSSNSTCEEFDSNLDRNYGFPVN